MRNLERARQSIASSFRLRRCALWVVGAVNCLAVGVIGLGAGGYFLYNHAHVDAVRSVDAIIVLGGAVDGRQAYGIMLAQQGISRRVVIANPPSDKKKEMGEFCATDDERFTVTCVQPHPSTTRGEALFTRDLAAVHEWKSVLVVTWQYHLPRARYIFSQCFPGEIVMRPVPREYDFSLAEWEYTYLYQTVGFAKAVLQGEC